MTAAPVAVPAPRLPWLAELHPAYFAMVMATGIVSLACHFRGLLWLAESMFWLNWVFYAVLCAALVGRVGLYPRHFLADLLHHGRCVGFFTTVAATGVLGSQTLIIGGNARLAMVLWTLSIALWAGFTYTIFTVLTVKSSKPTLAEGINGAWLLIVVAAQAVAVLGTQLVGHMNWSGGVAIFFCLSLWLGGGMLYIWIISLIFYRYTFFAFNPSDLSPPYWINMGAVAISTLAGSLLIGRSGDSELVQSMLPFIKGFTLLFWATATWWIPMLVILGFWRHAYRRFPLRYDPLYWGVVFPLGMYTVCTFRLAQVLELPFLEAIPYVFIWFALAAWVLALTGLVLRGLSLVGQSLTTKRRAAGT
jgi:tellurite resistance protein TehA-like permease